MKNPEISVIITTYNQEKYVVDAVNSVLAQTFKDYEIIVVDDGSKDGTKKALKRYERKISYYYKPNGGNATAKNYGLEKIKGNYVAFLDADDVWSPEKLELQYAHIIKNETVGVVYSPFALIDLSGNNLGKTHLPKVKKAYPKILYENFVGLSGTLVKKKCFEDCGVLDNKIRTHEDWDLWMRISRKYDFSCLDKILWLYRASKPGKLPQDQMKQRQKDFFRVINRAFNQDSELSYFFKQRCISNWYFDLAKACFFRRQIMWALKLNIASIINMPVQFKAYLFFPWIILRKLIKLFC